MTEFIAIIQEKFFFPKFNVFYKISFQLNVKLFNSSQIMTGHLVTRFEDVPIT